jgi:hypothetical protein
MTSDHLRIAESLPPQVRIAVTVLAINAKSRLLEQRRPRAERRPPLVCVLLSPYAEARAAAMAVIARHLRAGATRRWTRCCRPTFTRQTQRGTFSLPPSTRACCCSTKADALFGHGHVIDLPFRADNFTEALLKRMALYDRPVCFRWPSTPPASGYWRQPIGDPADEAT